MKRSGRASALLVLIGLSPRQPTEQAALWPLALGGGEPVDDARVGRRAGEGFTQQMRGTGVGAAQTRLQEAGEGAALELYHGQVRVPRRERQQAATTPIAVPDHHPADPALLEQVQEPVPLAAAQRPMASCSTGDRGWRRRCRRSSISSDSTWRQTASGSPVPPRRLGRRQRRSSGAGRWGAIAPYSGRARSGAFRVRYMARRLHNFGAGRRPPWALSCA